VSVQPRVQLSLDGAARKLRVAQETMALAKKEQEKGLNFSKTLTEMAMGMQRRWAGESLLAWPHLSLLEREVGLLETHPALVAPGRWQDCPSRDQQAFRRLAAGQAQSQRLPRHPLPDHQLLRDCREQSEG
jgi:hypothetical protein